MESILLGRIYHEINNDSIKGHTVKNIYNHRSRDPKEPIGNVYRILRTIGQYFFSSTRWLRPIVHIDLYKDEVEKSGIPKKNLDKNDDFVDLYFAVGFFPE